MKASFKLPDGSTFNPAIDGVSFNIDEFTIDIPAGSFKALGKHPQIYSYTTKLRDKPFVMVTLNLKKGEVSLIVRKANVDIVDNSDGVTVTFSLGSLVGTQTINMFIDSLTYPQQH